MIAVFDECYEIDMDFGWSETTKTILSPFTLGQLYAGTNDNKTEQKQMGFWESISKEDIIGE